MREPLRGDQPLQRITVQCVLTINLFNQVRALLRRHACRTPPSLSLPANLHLTVDMVRLAVLSEHLLYLLVGRSSCRL